MLLDIRLHVFLRRQSGLLELLFWHFLSCGEVDSGFDRELTHALSLLCHCRVKRAALNSFETRDVAIKPDNHDFVAEICHFHSLRGPQRQGIRATKEDRDIRVSLQHVLPNRKALILHPRVARLLCHDLQVGELRKGFIEAFVPILFRRCAELTLDNGDLGPSRQ